MQKDSIFKFFNEMRVATVHTRPIIPNKKVSINIGEPAISVTESLNVRVIRDGKVVEEHSSGDAKKTPSPLTKEDHVSKATRKVSRFFKEHPSDDLIKLCEMYLERLTKIVDECEQLFKISECVMPKENGDP